MNQAETELYKWLIQEVKSRVADTELYEDGPVRRTIAEVITAKRRLRFIQGGKEHARCEEKLLSISVWEKMGERLFYALRRLDILEPLLEDDEITDIMVNGPEEIYYERLGRRYRLRDSFESEKRLLDLIQQIVGSVNRQVSEASPIADARLPGGERVNIVLPPVSLGGPIVSIRRFRKKPITMSELIESGSVTEEMAQFLEQAVTRQANLFVCGGTSSGKTTLLNVLSEYIPKEERVITIEDSAELSIRGIRNLVSLETKSSSGISIRELIRTSLRMNPDRIIIGEVRGGEAFDMLSGMNTGHAAMSTGHANSCFDMLRRLESMVWMAISDIPLEAIRLQIAAALDYLIFVEKVRSGKRQIKEIVRVGNVGKDGEIELSPVCARKGEEITWY